MIAYFAADDGNKVPYVWTFTTCRPGTPSGSGAAIDAARQVHGVIEPVTMDVENS